MINFTTNPYYQEHPEALSALEITEGIKLAQHVIELHSQGKEGEFAKLTTLIGVGNDAGGKVYSLLGTKLCLKISPLGKHVGRKQELQFELNRQCLEIVHRRRIKLKGDWYALACSPAVAVASDDSHAYTMMIRLDNTTRLWDQENILFSEAECSQTLRKIKKLVRDYGGQPAIKAMDVNGNNLLMDLQNKIIYLIDPYVPAN